MISDSRSDWDGNPVRVCDAAHARCARLVYSSGWFLGSIFSELLLAHSASIKPAGRKQMTPLLKDSRSVLQPSQWVLSCLRRMKQSQVMPVLLATVLLGIIPARASASGWHDYELGLEHGYAIDRVNTFDVMLTRSDAILVSHHDFPQIGPITHYAQKGKTLFVRAAGWRARQLFEGDMFKEADLTQHFYFVVTDEPPSIEGPLSEAAFNAHALVTARPPQSPWTKPKNPHFWKPFMGDMAFVVLAIPILCVKYTLGTVPVTLLRLDSLSCVEKRISEWLAEILRESR